MTSPAGQVDPAEPQRVLLVTGGSRGIGAAVAELAAAAGWAVCLTYRTGRVEADEVVTRVRSAGGLAAAVRADVTVEADVLAAFDHAAGLGPLRAVVVNAGIVAPQGPLSAATAERLQEVVSVNVMGALLCSREAARRLPPAPGVDASIVLVSSVASRTGSPHEYVDYAATKGAVDALGLGLARELAGSGVRVNVVRPGITATEIHSRNGQPHRLRDAAARIPLGRPGSPEEVARATVWLCSGDASYCTGSVLDVAGGL